MQYLIILSVTLTIVFVAIRIIDRYKTKEFIKSASISDVTNHSLFNANMRAVIADLNNQRAIDAAKASERNGRLKNHPIEHLQDEGVFNAADMTELFIHSLQKTLIGYSQAERTFIKEVGMMAFNRTMIQLKSKAGMK